ncbi:class I SAM-dependent methyltransferase [Sorangium sp. So ce281]|uniref:class I SAM-dependent methyltransferase n=1 Tax=unclassified Sorangium TaxID=2621164 RepID=UPI003F5E3221
MDTQQNHDHSHGVTSGLKGYIVSQFGHPRGLVGRLVCAIMAWENRERNEWAVKQIDVQPTDHILEIGFGPGLAIRDMASLASRGLVAGVDPSEVVVREARKRNAGAIAAGRVELHQGSVAALPFGDASFDKVLAINSMHHWQDRAAGLREILRVLRPGGMITVIEQSHAKTDVGRPSGDDLVRYLKECGFQSILVTPGPIRKGATVCAQGTK